MKLIKLSADHYIIVDDSEIKDVRPYIDMYHLEEGTTINKFPTYLTDLSSCKVITHSTEPLDKSLFFTNRIWGCEKLSLGEVRQLLEPNVIKRKDEYLQKVKEEVKDFPQHDRFYILGSSDLAFSEGYNQALEDNKDKKYTEEDMIRAYTEGENVRYSKVGEAVLKSQFILSLQPKTQWDVEFIDGKLKLK